MSFKAIRFKSYARGKKASFGRRRVTYKCRAAVRNGVISRTSLFTLDLPQFSPPALGSPESTPEATYKHPVPNSNRRSKTTGSRDFPDWLVENVYLAPGRSTEAAAITNKLVEMSAPVPGVISAHAVGSKGISTSRRLANTQSPGKRSRGRTAGVESISSSKLFSSAQKQSEDQVAAPIVSDTHKGVARNWFAGRLIAGFSVVLLAMLIYLHDRRVFPGNIASQPVVQAPDAESGRTPGVKQPQTPGQSIATQKTSPTHLPLQEPAAIFSTLGEKSQLRKIAASSVPASTLDSTPSKRFLVTEPPETGFRYPVAPNPSLTGKVTLRMVIGVDGSVTRIDVLNGNHALALAAIQAVHHWPYAPHELRGNTAEAETSVVINFVGDEAVSVSFQEP